MSLNLYLALPDTDVSADQFRSAVRACKNLVKFNKEISQFKFIIPARSNLAGSISLEDRVKKIDYIDTLFVAFYEIKTTVIDFNLIPEGRLFWLNEKCQITTIDGKSSPYLDISPNDHIFQKLLPDQVSSIGSFPYGSISSDQRLLPLNSMGHRIHRDLNAISERPDHHKVVAIFGGSAAQSIYATYTGMFSNLLENKLNKHFEYFKYTVLNFAISGHLVTDEFFHYLFFCDQLSPDLVITFDGWNDLSNGLVNDSYLINKFKFIYQYQEEDKAAFLNEYNGLESLTSENEMITPKNTPSAVIDAYLFRLSQFKQYVTSKNIKFLSCLQPTIFSKGRRSKVEIEKLNNNNNNAKLIDIFDVRLPNVFNQIGETSSGMDFFNLHKLFEKYGDETLFEDRVHFNQNGEDVIADLLFNEVLKRKLFDEKNSNQSLL